MQLKKLTDSEYFSIQRYSNSDLTELERQLFNPSFKLPESAYRFGSMVHQYVLDGKEPDNATDLELNNLEGIAESLQDSKFWQRWNFGKKETSVLWEQDGSELKSKLDLILSYKNSAVVCDLKTTCQKTENGFLADVKRFNYYRQAAFYMDSVKAEKFEIWAVQKTFPFKVFTVAFQSNHQEIEKARFQYKRLLTYAEKTNFIPERWKQTQKYSSLSFV